MPASLTLSELHQRIQRTLKQEFTGSYWIIAEILELHVNRTGHCYLELIEKGEEHDNFLARAKGTIWASKYSMLRPFFEASTGLSFKSGIKLLFKASVEFHSLYGYSLNITDLDPNYTLGDLARKKQEVIKKIREEGVMEMNKELGFPLVPQRIAVISSETAAGFEDFQKSIQHNSDGFQFITRLFPAVMQGDEASVSMISALDAIYEVIISFDCVAILRGGGSKADMECFNDYDLAYYITQFPLPVITGIGHERDESVVDMVAARGLKTPTAAAEFLIEQLRSFEFRLTALQENLSFHVKRKVQENSAMLEKYMSDLGHLALEHLNRRAAFLHQVHQFMILGIGNFFSRKSDYLTSLGKQQALIDPENILKRGYSITLIDGKAIKDVEEVKSGDLLETKLYKGVIQSKVEKTLKKHVKSLKPQMAFLLIDAPKSKH